MIMLKPALFRAILFLTLPLALAWFAAAQESAPPTAAPADIGAAPAPSATPLPPRSVMLVCRFEPGADFTPAQKQLLFESLSMRLSSASEEVRIRAYPDLALSPQADLNQMAILSGVDAWIAVKVSGSMTAAQVHFRAYDLQKSIDFFELDVTATIDPRFRNAFSGLWSTIENKVASTIHQNRQINTVTFNAPEHSIVEIEDSQTVGPEQSSVFSLPAPASYLWRAYLPGYRAQSGKLFLDTDQVIHVEPKARYPVNLELGLEWMSFPLLRFAFRALPDTLDIDIGMVFYNFGIVPSYPTDTQTGLFRDFHMVNLLLGLRWYPLAHRYELRPWFGMGMQVRYLTNPTFYNDPISPVGFYLQLGLSIDIIPELAVFLELMPRFTYTLDPFLATSSLASAGHSNSGFNQTIASEHFLVEPWHFSIGVRIQP